MPACLGRENFVAHSLPVITRQWFIVPSRFSAPSDLWTDTDSCQGFWPGQASDLKPCRCQLKRRWIQAANTEPIPCTVAGSRVNRTAGKRVAGICVEDRTASERISCVRLSGEQPGKPGLSAWHRRKHYLTFGWGCRTIRLRTKSGFCRFGRLFDFSRACGTQIAALLQRRE